jgi:3-oxoacyl-[acyl-carrier-protein] synthase-3
MTEQTYLHGLAYTLGQLVPLESLPELQQAPDQLETLRALGLERFALAEQLAPDLALESARSTLQRHGISGEEVDAVVYATSTFWQEDAYRGRLRHFFHALGLSRAFPLCLFGSECSNVMTAIHTARALLRERGLRRVLVVSADCAMPGRRVMGGLASVFSDGAVSFLLGTEPGTLRLDDVALHASPGMWDVEPETNLVAFLRGNVSGAMHAVAACRAATGAEPDDFSLVLTGNYNESVLKTFRYALKLQRERQYVDNVARFAHSYSADTLINLLDCYEARLPPGARALLLATGHSTWGALSITRV